MTFTEDENGNLIEKTSVGMNKLIRMNELMHVKSTSNVWSHIINGKEYKFISKHGKFIVSNEDKKEIDQFLEEKKKKFSNFKIKMESIPSLTQNFNLARILPKKDWNKIRQESKERYENKCGICNTPNVKLNCHEVWEFDEINLIQSLKECIPLCTLCHMGIHPSTALYTFNEVIINKVFENFMKINECDKETYDEYKTYHMELQMYRSKCGYLNSDLIWKMNYGKYQSLVEDKYGNINNVIKKLSEERIKLTIEDELPVKMTFDELMNCDNKKHNNGQKSMMDF